MVAISFSAESNLHTTGIKITISNYGYRNLDFGFRKEIRFYIFGKQNSNLFYIKITRCQVKLIHILV